MLQWSGHHFFSLNSCGVASGLLFFAMVNSGVVASHAVGVAAGDPGVAAAVPVGNFLFLVVTDPAAHPEVALQIAAAAASTALGDG